MDLTPKQQTSEAIRQAESILITTGQHPSVDQVSAVIGLSAILRKFGKKVSAIVSDGLPQSAQLLDSNGVERNLSGMRDFVLKLDVSKAEVDKLRYEVIDSKLNIFVTPFKGGFAPSDVTFDYGDFHYDLAIVLGVPTRARIDRVFEQNASMFEHIPLVNLDFHRSNENYGAVNLIEPNASSLCEMLVALAESLQGGIIDADIATSLLMGIMASTDRFTAAHTTSKSLTVAAQMMAAGAKQQAVVRALYRDNKGGEGRSGDGRATGGDRGDRGGNDRSGGERSGDRDRGDRGQRNEPRGGQQDRSGSGGRNQEQVRATEPVRTANESPRIEPARNEQARPSEPEQPEFVRATEPTHVPEHKPAPEEQPREISAEHTMPMPPVGDVEDDQTIIHPSHIELSEPAEATAVPEQMAVDAPPMADFAAAAEILAQRNRDENTQASE